MQKDEKDIKKKLHWLTARPQEKTAKHSRSVRGQTESKRAVQEKNNNKEQSKQKPAGTAQLTNTEDKYSEQRKWRDTGKLHRWPDNKQEETRANTKMHKRKHTG